MDKLVDQPPVVIPGERLVSLASLVAPTERELRHRVVRTALSVALGYGVLGIAWIVASDRWLARWSSTPGIDWLPASTFKGVAFVVVTAVALYFLVWRGLSRWHSAQNQANASGTLMRTVAETMPDALVVLDVAGRIVFANRHAQVVLGVSRDAMRGLDYDAPQWAILRLDGAPMPSAELPFARVLNECRPVLGVVHTIQPPGGERRVLSVNAAPLWSNEQQMVGVVANIRDVTAEHQRELADARTRRALHALADFGAFALHAHAPAEIWDYACNALVEHRLCVQCWLGAVNADAARSIVPMASAGVAREYVDTLQVTWDSSETGRGPAGQAVRSRSAIFVDDIANDPGFRRWRDAAQARGFVCAFAMPVLDDAGSPTMVLVGYERDRRAYQFAEKDHLCEFARRIGLATEAIRRRQSRERTETQTRKALQGTISAVQRTVEARDPYTHGHQERVAELCVAIANELGFPSAQRHMLEIAAKLHDVGKLMVPAEILSKPTRLSKAEYELVKGHVDAGYQILGEIDFGMPVAEVMRQHHERLDGSGYPLGLRGDQISLEARVLAVADVAESMLSHRPYRAALGIEAVTRELLGGRGSRYDPDAVDACLRVLPEQAVP